MSFLGRMEVIRRLAFLLGCLSFYVAIREMRQN
jgi:hypothetical protein